MKRLQFSGEKAGAQRYPVLGTAALLCVLSGCASTELPAVPTNWYALSEPVPALVRHRVHEDDELELVLRDGSVVVLTVAAVDERAIHGEDGQSVAIADIRELRAPRKEDVGDVALGIAAYAVLIPVSIILFPVALGALVFYDWEKVELWSDERLCRVVAHPQFYGYSADGAVVEDDKAPPFQEVQAELAKRAPTCDAPARVETYCAARNDTGPGFVECTVMMLPLEEAGLTTFHEWAEAPLCRLNKQPETFEALVDLSPEQREWMSTAARATMESRDLACPEVEQTESGAATN